MNNLTFNNGAYKLEKANGEVYEGVVSNLVAHFLTDTITITDRVTLVKLPIITAQSNDLQIGGQTKTFEQIKTIIETELAKGGGASTADAVSYDNTTSGLQSTNVQDAIDEVGANLGEYESKVDSLMDRADLVSVQAENVGYGDTNVSDELNKIGTYKCINIRTANRYGKYWNGSTFRSATGDYNGVLIPLVVGHKYRLSVPVVGILTKVIISGNPSTSWELIRQTDEVEFIAESGEDNLYITINTSQLLRDFYVYDTSDGILTKANVLDNYFGVSQFSGKKALIFGDSITCTNDIAVDGSLTFRKYNWTFLTMQALQCEWHNYAQDGAQWIDASNLSQYQKVSEQITLAIRNISSADLIILSLGTNNWGEPNDTFDSAITISSLDELDRTKTHQAIRWALWKLRIAYPEARLFVCLPLQRADHKTKSGIFDAMTKMAEVYGACVFDQFSEVGIISSLESWGTSGLYLSDGLHTNLAGRTLQAKYITKKLLQYYIDYNNVII